jgi:hypothetical protein
MITLTLNDIFNAVPALREISTKEFPGSTTFKIARLIRELDKEIQLFEEERMKIANKYGEKDENGNLIPQENGTIKIPDDKVQECNEEFQALFNTQVEINANKLPIEIFDSIEMTPTQAMNLEAIVDFE